MLSNKIRPVIFGYRTILLLMYLKLFHSAKGWKFFFGDWDIFRVDSGRLQLDHGIWIEKHVLLHCVSGVINVGRRTFINRGAMIVCRKEVTIGNDVLIGDNVAIYDHDHGLEDNGSTYGQQEYFVAPVIIEDNVWIGSHSVILKGVTISTSSVVAAGSVVTTNIPPREVWGGVPARLIKKI